MFRKKPPEPRLPAEWLIVGLGNPGPEYAHTRHNVGFDVIDLICQQEKAKLTTRKHRAVYGPVRVAETEVVLMKPLTYMNLSGQAISPLLRELGLKPDKLLIITDDLDLPTGKIRIRAKGSHGGHNGHRSIQSTLATQDYPRIKIGIGKASDKPTVDHVLTRFNPDDQAVINDVFDTCIRAVEKIVTDGVLIAMNEFNGGSNSD